MERLISSQIIEKYRAANKRVVLLDYDGTLVSYTLIPGTNRLSEDISDILIKLADDPKTEIFIITGRGYLEIDKIMDHLPVTVIAEHGAMIREGGKWERQINDDASWKEKISPILNQITASCPGSFVEEKTFSLAWHYRNADRKAGYDSSRELISTLGKIINSLNLKILDGNKVVEIMTRDTGKGIAVKKLFEQNNYDFILSIGDDVTDEEMFEYFLHVAGAVTIKVGYGESFARYNIQGISDVILLLKQLSG